MDYVTPVILGIGLSMDCFAVALAIGTTTKTRLIYAAAIIAACFGIFQMGMTLAGWLAGSTLVEFISTYDHWIAFLLLAIIGVKMIMEGILGEEDKTHIEAIRFVPVIVLSVATSVDALAAGVSFGVLQSAVLIPAIIIGAIAFIVSFAGVMLGERLEVILSNKAEIVGGLILILIGTRILVQSIVVKC